MGAMHSKSAGLGSGPMVRQAGSAVPRMVLGARLRRLREASGPTRQVAGHAIGISDAELDHLELGLIGVNCRAVADLLTLYGVVDEAERATLMALAEQAGMPGWWQPYGDIVPSWMQAYLGLEQTAGVIRSFEVQHIPSLLQTEDYARTVIRLGYPDAPDAHNERRVELRMRRQQILFRPAAPHLWAVIDEAVLRREVGGEAVMRAQIQHLIDMSYVPHVTVQMLPLEVGGYAEAKDPVTIMRLREDGLPDVVYLERLTSAVYMDKTADVDHYGQMMNRLATMAESARATRTLLRWMLSGI